MVFENDTDGKTAQVQNHQLESTTNLSTSGKAEDPEKNKYLLDLRKDTAFKAVFRQKEFLLNLLNSLPIREGKITDLVYNPTESLPAYTLGKKVVFDLKCTTESGEIFIVEMQIAKQDYFKERALYYVSRSIDEQLRRNDEEVEKAQTDEEKKEKIRNYRIEPVIGIFLTCFSLGDEPRMVRDIILADQTNGFQQFSDKMRMVFLELPSIASIENCDTDLKKWLYVINNSRNMENIPFAKDMPIFKQLQEKARHDALTPQEQELYEQELRNDIAYWGSIVYAEKKAEEIGLAKGLAKGLAEGRAEGRTEGRAEGEAKGKAEERLALALKFKELGTDVSVIQQATGLTLEEINNL